MSYTYPGAERLREALTSAAGCDRIAILAELALCLAHSAPEAALDLLSEASTLLESPELGAEPVRSRLEADCRAARSVAWLGTDRVAECGAEAERILDSEARPQFRASAHGVIGRLAERDGHPHRAEQALRAGLEILSAFERRESVVAARLLNDSGRLRFARCDYPGAMRFFSEARLAAAAVGERVLEATCRMNEGNVLSQIGDVEGCLVAYHASLAIHREEGYQPGIARSLGNLAIVEMRRQEFEQALQFFDEALALSGPPRWQQETRVARANCLVGLERRDEARHEIEEALRFFVAIGDRTLEAEALLAEARCAGRAGDIEAASSKHRECLRVLREHPSPWIERRCRLQMAGDAVAAGDAQAAVEDLQNLREQAARDAQKGLLVDALEQLVPALEAVGDLSGALECAKELVTRSRDLYLEERSNRIETLEVVHQVEAARHREKTLEQARRALEERVDERTRELLSSQEERSRLEHELQHAQKMEAVGRLAGGVAHDFNNLLTVIRGFTDRLSTDIPPQARHHALRTIVDATDRAASLTSQLLTFSRKRASVARVIDVNDVLRDLTPMIDSLVPESVDCRIELAEGKALVFADPGQLEQVILNLIINACDAMPDGGALIVETSRRDCDGLLRQQEGGRVVVVVRDTGCGMSAEIRQSAFDPFFTTKEHGEGTGLGLATAYGIIQQSGGEITVDSQVGRGSCFEVFLPAAIGEVTDPMPPERSLPSREGSRIHTVLLVEDEEAILELERLALEEAGYRVLTAANGGEALDIAADSERQIDVVVTDVVMPRLGGEALFEQLRESRPSLRFLFTSGYPEGMRRLLREAMFLEKPFGLDEFCARVSAIVEGDPAVPIE